MSTFEHRRDTFAATFRKMRNVEFWDDWKPWIAFVTVGLFFIGGWGIALNATTLKKDAVHRAAVQSCLDSRPLVQKFSRHVEGVNDGFAALVANYANTLKHTPTSDPQYQVRLTNLRRLRSAARKVAELPEIPVPTKADCQQKGGPN